MAQPIIRTSDRIQFKRCRRAWDIGSKIRQNLEPVVSRPALEFGSAFHAALEVYYNPATWSWIQDDRRIVVQELARKAAHDSLQKQFNMIAKFRGDGADLTDLREQFQEHHDLANGMLNYFIKWAGPNDELTPVYVEIEFNIPIVWPPEVEYPGIRDVHFGVNHEGYLTYNGEVVYYQGRIDMIAQDREGRYWIVDHKTAARLTDTTEFLELDEQMKSYAWAARLVLGIDIKGVVYSEHVKGYPQPPQELTRPYKGRWLSTNKQQDTSLELFLEALKVTGEAPELYADYIYFLQQEGRQYIRRTPVNFSVTELDNLGRQIAFEAVDMLGDPFTYPSPDKFSCKWCDHRTLCLAMNDGSDTEYIKQTYYVSRSKT